MKFIRQLDIAENESNAGLPGIIGNVNGTPDSQIINPGSFNNYVPQDWSPQQQQAYQNTQGAPTGHLAATDYYPTLNHNIGVGNYSGSEIGSTTLFAPAAGVVPLAMLDARDAATQRAALQKLKEQEEFDKRYKGYNTKHVAVQQEASKQYQSGLQQWVSNAKQKYGKDWVHGLQTDPNFNAWDKAHQDFAKYHDAIVDHAAELQQAEKDPNFVMSPELKQAHGNMMSGAYTLGTGGAFTSKARNIENDFLASKALYDLDKASNITIDKAMPKINEADLSGLKFKGRGTEQFVDQVKQTYFPEEQRKALAHNLYMEKYQGTDITEQQVRSAIDSKLNDKIEHQIKNYDTYHAPVRGGDEDYSKAVPQVKSDVNQTVAAGRGTPYNIPGTHPVHMETVFNTTAKDQQKELTFKLNKDVLDLDGKELNEESGYVKGQVQQLAVFPYYTSEKRYLTPKEAEGLGKLDELYNRKGIEWKAGALVNVTPKTDAKGNIAKSKTVIVPAEDVKGKFGESFDKNVVNKVVDDASRKNEQKAQEVKEIKRKTKDGKIAIFDENTKKFLRYE